MASTVNDCRHLDIIGSPAQFDPVLVLCMIPAAVPCVMSTVRTARARMPDYERTHKAEVRSSQMTELATFARK